MTFKALQMAQVRRAAAAEDRAALRSAMRGMLRTLEAAVLSAALGFAAWHGWTWAARSDAFAMREVVFTGLVHAREPELLEAQRPRAGGEPLPHRPGQGGARAAGAAVGGQRASWAALAGPGRDHGLGAPAGRAGALGALYVLDEQRAHLQAGREPEDALDLPVITGLSRDAWLDRNAGAAAAPLRSAAPARHLARDRAAARRSSPRCGSTKAAASRSSTRGGGSLQEIRLGADDMSLELQRLGCRCAPPWPAAASARPVSISTIRRAPIRPPPRWPTRGSRPWRRRRATSSSDSTSAPPRSAASSARSPTRASTSSASAPHPRAGCARAWSINIDATVASIKRAVEEAELMAGVRDQRGLRRHRRRPHPRLQLARRGRGEGQGSARRRDIDRVLDAAQGRHHPAGPRDPPRAAAGVHRRRAGRHPRAARHERACGWRPRCTSSPRRSPARRTSSSAAQPHRPHTSPTSCSSRSPRPRRCSPTTRRSSASRWSTSAAAPPTSPSSPDGAILHTSVHAARRQPPHQRHRGGAAHADARGREDQAQVRLRAERVAATRTRPSRCRQRRRPRAARAQRGASSARSSSRGWRRSSSWCSARSRRPGYEDLLASGVVLTGGSTSLHGMPELAEEVLGLPVRRGLPRGHRRPRRRGEEPAARDRGGPCALRGAAGQGQPRLHGRAATIRSAERFLELGERALLAS